MAFHFRFGTVLLALLSCGSAQAQPTLSDRIDDLRLETTVQLALAESAETRLYEVDVQSAGGVIVLSGLVPTLGARDRVVALVSGLPGVRTVRSTLRLEGQPAEPLEDPVVRPVETRVERNEVGNDQSQPAERELNNVDPTFYTVRAGDTLYSIARRHETTVDAISDLNNLQSTTVRVGQRLRVR